MRHDYRRKRRSRPIVGGSEVAHAWGRVPQQVITNELPLGGGCAAGTVSVQPCAAASTPTNPNVKGSIQNRLLAHWKLVGQALCDKRLAQSDTAVLWWILQRIGDDGTCWPGLGSLSADTGFHRTSVVRAISNLAHAGYIVRLSGAGPKGTNRYRAGSSADAPSSAHEPSSTDATSSTDAPGVGAPTHLGVGAPVLPESIPINQTKEPDQIKRVRRAAEAHAERFAEFWAAYPRKENKKRALAIWKRLKLDEHADDILANVTARVVGDPQWTNLQFVPMPTTYLHGERWHDGWQSRLTSSKPPIAQNFANKTYEVPDDLKPAWLRSDGNA